MNGLRLAEKIIDLRHDRKITQEQLADFLGVTKASVSKWENRQSLPDITLLPQLAAFFGVTVDELLGYEPQLGKEQIQKIYQELATAFARKPYEEVMKESRGYVKRYYSCFPLLQQICVLWLNHYMLAGTQEEQHRQLQEIKELCNHIIDQCKESGICEEARSMGAMVNLLLGKPQEVIEELEDVVQMKWLSPSNEGLLIQAYQMMGDVDKAASYAQISMYLQMLGVVGSMVQYQSICAADLAMCEETLRRADAVIEAFDLAHLHPNLTIQVEYQAAGIYMMHQKREEALERLKNCVKLVRYLLQKDGKNLQLHGDAYFNYVNDWIEKLELGGSAPRHRGLVVKDAASLLEHPQFQALAGDARFERLKNLLREDVLG